jgi:hypothetical protein
MMMYLMTAYEEKRDRYRRVGPMYLLMKGFLMMLLSDSTASSGMPDLHGKDPRQRPARLMSRSPRVVSDDADHRIAQKKLGRVLGCFHDGDNTADFSVELLSIGRQP